MISMDMNIEHHDNHHAHHFHHLPLCAAGKSDSKSKTRHNHLNIIPMIMSITMITTNTMKTIFPCWLDFQDKRRQTPGRAPCLASTM